MPYSFDETILDNSKVEENSRIRPMISVKKNFDEAISDCNGVSVDAFFNELDERIKNGVIIRDMSHTAILIE